MNSVIVMLFQQGNHLGRLASVAVFIMRAAPIWTNRLFILNCMFSGKKTTTGQYRVSFSHEVSEPPYQQKLFTGTILINKIVLYSLQLTGHTEK